jgi:predicted DNA-binding antitoxin AbrB/MazE fold protein
MSSAQQTMPERSRRRPVENQVQVAGRAWAWYDCLMSIPLESRGAESIMELTIEATYENGVLKLAAPLPLSEHERVQVVIRPAISRAQQTAGLMGWTGSEELADRFAMDSELEYPSAGKP